MKTVLVAAGLLFAPGLARAQEATQPATSNSPAPDTVGPRELQNFSLPGTAKPADQSAPEGNGSNDRADTAPAETAPSASTSTRGTAETRKVATVVPVPAPVAQSPAPAIASAPTAAASTSAQPQPPLTAPASAAPVPAPSEPLSSEYGISILPWLFAAIVLAGGTLLLLWRRRPREALAGGAEFDLFVPPEPAPAPLPPQRAPAPEPTPAPPKRAGAAANGIVASRLRPSLEITMQPLRCLIEDSQVTIEFEVELFNAGAAPARAVLAEASLLNGGAAQDQELSAFFANPVGAGERMDAIPPMRRVTLASRVVAPRSAIQEYELAGRKAFVPVIAFNTLYEWSGGKGQSSLAYLVGRETRTDKLGPLRLDGGSRDLRGLGARPLPVELRT